MTVLLTGPLTGPLTGALIGPLITAPLTATAPTESWRQIGELLLAFALTAVIGLERQIRGKSAGLRTQTIVGTSAALIMLVSKYGFSDVLRPQLVVVDPSRVAAQIVSGIGFLGAGLIITRRGAVRGLTTAASVWETAAIGMAAGAGLPILALFVTALHFVIVLGFSPVRRLASRHAEHDYTITYEDGRGVLRDLLTACTDRTWTVNSLNILRERYHEGDADREHLVTVTITLTGTRVVDAPSILGAVEGVVRVDRSDDEDDD